ncbi:MAG: hypothetical protein MUC83_03120 [Pirellula sp.]|nr:hypothetical protein [Pirellula sp.]
MKPSKKPADVRRANTENCTAQKWDEIPAFYAGLIRVAESTCAADRFCTSTIVQSVHVLRKAENSHRARLGGTGF